jgi:hypothetical protein
MPIVSNLFLIIYMLLKLYVSYEHCLGQTVEARLVIAANNFRDLFNLKIRSTACGFRSAVSSDVCIQSRYIGFDPNCSDLQR